MMERDNPRVFQTGPTLKVVTKTRDNAAEGCTITQQQFGKKQSFEALRKQLQSLQHLLVWVGIV